MYVINLDKSYLKSIDYYGNPILTTKIEDACKYESEFSARAIQELKLPTAVVIKYYGLDLCDALKEVILNRKAIRGCKFRFGEYITLNNGQLCIITKFKQDIFTFKKYPLPIPLENYYVDLGSLRHQKYRIVDHLGIEGLSQ